MTSEHSNTRWLVPAGLCVAILALSGNSLAGDTSAREKALRYQDDKQACMSGNTHQVLDACLKEAKAVYAQKPGSIPEVSAAQLAHNATLRCDALKGADHADCLARMRGEGTTQGSVEGGGIYRELVTPGGTVPSSQ